MKFITYFLLLVLLLVFSSCKSSFTEEDRTKLITLQNQIKEQSFEFKANAVIPFNTQALNSVANDLLIRTGNSTARIHVQGDNYTLKIGEKQAVFALPFYGERRIGGGYTNDTGFNFTAVIKDLTSTMNEKKGYISYEFRANNKTETLDIELQFYSPNTVKLSINSSHRTSMKYDGYIKWLEIEEE
ncbi:MAG: hypothetical protein ACJAT0_002546 [Nonlabens sp.]|jgi:hypothetical protein|uniref:DUF4251 domain-containing protein n=1 Tax=Nonlabens sp. TaxID=1888209 RepID=UPI0039E6A8E7